MKITRPNKRVKTFFEFLCHIGSLISDDSCDCEMIAPARVWAGLKERSRICSFLFINPESLLGKCVIKGHVSTQGKANINRNNKLR